MKFLALIAVVSARKLAELATGELDAWNAWEAAEKAVTAAQNEYLSAKAAARHAEGEMQREINETIAQENKYKAAQDVAV